MLNSIDSKKVHDTLKNTVGKSLIGHKNQLINKALNGIALLSDAQSLPGLPVGTVSGGKLLSRDHRLAPSTSVRHLAKLRRRVSSPGGISSRTRSKVRVKSHRDIGRTRGTSLKKSHRGHLNQHSNQNGGLSLGRRSRHRSAGAGTMDVGRNSLQHDTRRSSLHGSETNQLGTSHIRLAKVGPSFTSSMSYTADLTNARLLRIEPSRSLSQSVTKGVSDAHLIASLLDQGHLDHPDLTALMPNFVAEEPQIFVDKQSNVKDTYPQIVVGRPEPLLAAPILPLALGSDGHVLTSSNTQIKEVLKSVLNTLSNSQSLSQQGIGSLLRSIRNTVNGPRKSLVTGILGPRIELSPIIHAGSKAVSTENIIRIKETGKVSPIVLKTGGQLEISSGLNRNPTFKIYGFKPSSNGGSNHDEKDSDDKKKKN